MRRTLLLIPHEIAGLPFNIWLLILLAVALASRLFWASRRGESVAAVLRAEGVMWAVGFAVLWFVTPMIELRDSNGQPVGMAIRGYGVMLLAAVASAVGLAAVRAKNRGINPDVILNMAPWAFVGGIVGARLFYVIQYRDHFVGNSFGETIRNMMAFTEGGLVVYGSFIGGFIAVVVFIARHQLPLLKLGDAIVPCLFLGVFLGRIGCLMNGCCYGGRCEDDWAALHFPRNSPVYQEQLSSGELLGMDIERATGEITQVRPGSLADQSGIKIGSTLNQLTPVKTRVEGIPEEEAPIGIAAMVDNQPYHWAASQLPDRALPVFAAQLISSAGGLGLCLALCAASYVTRREGTVMLLGFAGYAVLRFVLELIRVDEAGQFGTSLSISQWVSIVVLACAIAGMVWIYRRPANPSSQATAVT